MTAWSSSETSENTSNVMSVIIENNLNDMATSVLTLQRSTVSRQQRTLKFSSSQPRWWVEDRGRTG